MFSSKFDGDNRISVERTWKRDGSANRMHLWEALTVLQRLLGYRAGKRILLRRQLLCGRTVETEHATYRVVP